MELSRRLADSGITANAAVYLATAPAVAETSGAYFTNCQPTTPVPWPRTRPLRSGSGP